MAFSPFYLHPQHAPITSVFVFFAETRIRSIYFTFFEDLRKLLKKGWKEDKSQRTMYFPSLSMREEKVNIQFDINSKQHVCN